PGDQVRRRDTDVAEHDLAVPMLTLVAEQRQAPLDLHAGGVAGDEDHRLPSVRLGVRIGHADHDEHLAPLVERPGDVPLAAVDDVVITVPDDRGGQVGRVGGGYV